MLKIIESPDKPAPSKNDGSRSTSSRNNNNRPVFRKNNINDEVDGFGINKNAVKYAKKLGKSFKSKKLSKLGKLKSEKTSKSQNLAKSGKKLSKSRNSTNFNIMEARPKFLTPNTRTTFNRLRLAFTKALIL